MIILKVNNHFPLLYAEKLGGVVFARICKKEREYGFAFIRHNPRRGLHKGNKRRLKNGSKKFTPSPPKSDRCNVFFKSRRPFFKNGHLFLSIFQNQG